MVEAICGPFVAAALIDHEALFTGADLLKFSPVPGLEPAGKMLLSIWDAVEKVEVSVMGTPFVALLALTADMFRQIV